MTAAPARPAASCTRPAYRRPAVLANEYRTDGVPSAIDRTGELTGRHANTASAPVPAWLALAPSSVLDQEVVGE